MNTYEYESPDGDKGISFKAHSWQDAEAHLAVQKRADWYPIRAWNAFGDVLFDAYHGVNP